jgi:D-tyrosyl-tRNA(Tyr) deacylase
VRAVVQRVSRAGVTVDGESVGAIKRGLLVLLGISGRDSDADVLYYVEKILNLRIFEDEQDKMNLSVLDLSGDLLVVSQFTLYGDTRRGRRPSFIDAARPAEANRLYEHFVGECRKKIARVETGRFQATMDVELVNDGPVTILIDSEKLF